MNHGDKLHSDPLAFPCQYIKWRCVVGHRDTLILESLWPPSFLIKMIEYAFVLRSNSPTLVPMPFQTMAQRNHILQHPLVIEHFTVVTRQHDMASLTSLPAPSPQALIVER